MPHVQCYFICSFSVPLRKISYGFRADFPPPVGLSNLIEFNKQTAVYVVLGGVDIYPLTVNGCV